jgi:hypothetical protein
MGTIIPLLTHPCLHLTAPASLHVLIHTQSSCVAQRTRIYTPMVAGPDQYTAQREKLNSDNNHDYVWS